MSKMVNARKILEYFKAFLGVLVIAAIIVGYWFFIFSDSLEYFMTYIVPAIGGVIILLVFIYRLILKIYRKYLGENTSY